MNTYQNIWAVRVEGQTTGLEPGNMITVTTKAGKVKQERVRAVIERGVEHGRSYTLVMVEPRVKSEGSGLAAGASQRFNGGSLVNL